MKRGWIFLGTLCLGACGGSQAAPPASPNVAKNPTTTTSTPPYTSPDPWSLPDGPRDEQKNTSPSPLNMDAWAKATKQKGIQKAPAACGAYAKRTPEKTKPADVMVTLLEKDPHKRDAILLAIEDPTLVAGPARAMRAMLAPT